MRFSANRGRAPSYNDDLDAAMPVYEMKTLAAQLDQTLLTERLIALLSAGFGLLATLLASVAGLIPARRASRIDPILALRYE